MGTAKIYYCYGCGEKKVSNAMNNNVLKGGPTFLPLCKQCTNERLKKYTEKTKSVGGGLWCLLAELNIPFLERIWMRTQKELAESPGKLSPFLTYLKYIRNVKIDLEGFWQSDMMLDQFIKLKGQKDRRKGVDALDVEYNEVIWGKFTIDEYNFLNKTYQDYTRNMEHIDANLERRYRDLAKAELKKRVADENGDVQEIAKAQDNLKKMLDMLGLSDYTSKSQDERLKFIDRLTWMIEETEPAELEDQKKYRDIAGYEKIYDSWMRSMQNMIAGTRDYPKVPKAEQ